MTNEALDALARRANDAGFPTIPEYAVALEATIEHSVCATCGGREAHYCSSAFHLVSLEEVGS